MAEGRFLSRSIAHSDQLAAVSDTAETVFYRCLPHLDVEGRMRGETKLVKATAAPLKDKLTLDVIDRALDELEAAALVERYEADGVAVLHFPGFHRHQRNLRRDREAPSRLPSKPAQVRRRPARRREDAGKDAGKRRTSSGVTPETSGLKVKGSEGQGEGKGQDSAAGAAAPKPQVTWLTPFDDAWQARCGGKLTYGQAAKILRPLVDELGADVALLRWQRYLAATEPPYCSVKRFAETHGIYADDPALAGLTDEPQLEWVE